MNPQNSQEATAFQRPPQRIYNQAISMKAAGRKDPDIYQELLEMGVDATAAQAVVAEVSQQVRGANNKVAYRNILIGGLICAIGLGITLFSFSEAGETGRYRIAWGAIVFGGIQLYRGMAQRVK